MPLTPELTEIVCPGFGIHPDILQRPQWLWVPFPGQFLQALGRVMEDFDGNPLPKLFTKKWEKFWLDLMGASSIRNMCRKFFEGDGYRALREIEAKGCDANLVMSLFVQYLWDERIPSSESKDPNVIAHQEVSAAMERILRVFRSHVWKITLETRLVDATLVQLQSIIQAMSAADFRAGRHAQNDKQNRVIYALSSHFKQAAQSPNWSLLLRLLVGAGAIFANESKNFQSDRAARRIVPRIQVFKKEHPKEAKLLPAFVATWSISSRDSRIAERTRILALLPPPSK